MLDDVLDALRADDELEGREQRVLDARKLF
jgi:hypothetical protein